jgi:peptidoglycan-associated lipoprotein
MNHGTLLLSSVLLVVPLVRLHEASGSAGSQRASSRPTPIWLDMHFALDRYDISAEAARILDANAVWLRAHTHDLLRIEGHTDERGTSAYNFALGDRRATVAKNYLVSRGVHAARITTISSEQPVCRRQDNEPC